MRRFWLLPPLFALVLLGLLRLALKEQPRREAEWIIGTTSSLGVFFARISRSDSGLLRNQLSTRILLLEPDFQPLEYRGWGLAVAPMSTPSEALVEEQGRTRLLLQAGESLNGRLELAGTERQKPLRMEGMLRFGGLEGGALQRLSGWAVRSHTVAKGSVKNRALYLVGASFALAVDPLSQPEAWWWREGQRWEGAAPPLPEGPRFTVQVGGIELRLRSPYSQTLDTMPQLLPPERWAATLAGFPPPQHTVSRVVASWEGGSLVGLLLDRH